MSKEEAIKIIEDLIYSTENHTKIEVKDKYPIALSIALDVLRAIK